MDYLIVSFILGTLLVTAIKIREWREKRQQRKARNAVRYDVKVELGNPKSYLQAANETPMEHADRLILLYEEKRKEDQKFWGRAIIEYIELNKSRMRIGHLCRDIYVRRTINTYQGRESLTYEGGHGS